MPPQNTQDGPASLTGTSVAAFDDALFASEGAGFGGAPPRPVTPGRLGRGEAATGSRPGSASSRGTGSRPGTGAGLSRPGSACWGQSGAGWSEGESEGEDEGEGAPGPQPPGFVTQFLGGPLKEVRTKRPLLGFASFLPAPCPVSRVKAHALLLPLPSALLLFRGSEPSCPGSLPRRPSRRPPVPGAKARRRRSCTPLARPRRTPRTSPGLKRGRACACSREGTGMPRPRRREGSTGTEKTTRTGRSPPLKGARGTRWPRPWRARR
jgi:hypothetical protein